MFAGISDNGWNQAPRKNWSTLLGFTLQTCALLWLLALPFLSTQSLPELRISPALLTPVSLSPLASSQARAAQQAATVISKPAPNWVRKPDYLPHGLQPEASPSQPPGFGEVGLGHATDGVAIGFWDGLAGRPLDVAPPPTPTVAPKPRLSRMMEGNLILRVQPDYPPLARLAGIQGSVVLRAIISREGSIENLRVESGHPLLLEAAIRAVRQWRYRPYLLDDQPVEVETQITIHFNLGGR